MWGEESAMNRVRKYVKHRVEALPAYIGLRKTLNTRASEVVYIDADSA